MEEYGSSVSSNREFDSPSGLALDEDNDLLYVADTNNDRVQIISITRGSSTDEITFSEEFGTKGDDNKEFDEPTDLAISNNGKNLYVVDSKNDRIKIFEINRWGQVSKRY